MTREEWYRSPDCIKLRFLNNISSHIRHTTQEFNDVLQLILAERPDLWVFDKFSLCERQSRIVALEASRLCDYAMKLDSFLEPKQYDDVCKKCNNRWENGVCPTCSAKQPLAVPNGPGVNNESKSSD